MTQDFDFDLLQGLRSLGELVNKVAQNDLLDWFGRIKLIDCICDFIVLDPHIGQVITFWNTDFSFQCLMCMYLP